MISQMIVWKRKNQAITTSRTASYILLLEFEDLNVAKVSFDNIPIAKTQNAFPLLCHFGGVVLSILIIFDGTIQH